MGGMLCGRHAKMNRLIGEYFKKISTQHTISVHVLGCIAPVGANNVHRTSGIGGRPRRHRPCRCDCSASPGSGQLITSIYSLHCFSRILRTQGRHFSELDFDQTHWQSKLEAEIASVTTQRLISSILGWVLTNQGQPFLQRGFQRNGSRKSGMTVPRRPLTNTRIER